MIQIIRDIVSACFLFGGMFLCLSTVIGMHRLPDFYTRCHASGVSETLGLLLTCVGFIIQAGFTPLSLKLVLLFIIVCICNPIGGHILAKSAYETGFPMKTIEKKEEK